jgi:hypothetical protein
MLTNNKETDSTEILRNPMFRLTSIEESTELSGHDIASQSPPEIMEIVLEYARINSRCDRRHKDELLMDEIMKAAEENPILEFWLSEIDHILGHQQGNLNEDARDSYEDQHAVLREYLSHNTSILSKAPKKPVLTKKQGPSVTTAPNSIPRNHALKRQLQNQ